MTHREGDCEDCGDWRTEWSAHVLENLSPLWQVVQRITPMTWGYDDIWIGETCPLCKTLGGPFVVHERMERFCCFACQAQGDLVAFKRMWMATPQRRMPTRQWLEDDDGPF